MICPSLAITSNSPLLHWCFLVLSSRWSAFTYIFAWEFISGETQPKVLSFLSWNPLPQWRRREGLQSRGSGTSRKVFPLGEIIAGGGGEEKEENRGDKGKRRERGSGCVETAAGVILISDSVLTLSLSSSKNATFKDFKESTRPFGLCRSLSSKHLNSCSIPDGTLSVRRIYSVMCCWVSGYPKLPVWKEQLLFAISGLTVWLRHSLSVPPAAHSALRPAGEMAKTPQSVYQLRISRPFLPSAISLCMNNSKNMYVPGTKFMNKIIIEFPL